MLVAYRGGRIPEREFMDFAAECSAEVRLSGFVVRPNGSVLTAAQRLRLKQ